MNRVLTIGQAIVSLATFGLSFAAIIITLYTRISVLERDNVYTKSNQVELKEQVNHVQTQQEVQNKETNDKLTQILVILQNKQDRK